jgi:hypothetical protein
MSKKEQEAVKQAAKWVVRALDEMNGAIKAGDVSRLSVANDRVQKQSSSMKTQLRRLAGYELD